MLQRHANPEGLSYTPTAAGHAWELPARKNLGKLRLIGLIPLILSLVFPVIVWLFVGGFFTGWGAPSWVETLGPLLVGGLVYLSEWKFWRFGVAILIGRAGVQIEGENIIAIERMPFRSWKRTFKMSDVTKVEISGPSGSDAPASDRSTKKPGPMSDMVGIMVYFDKKKKALAVGYPLGLLEPLAVQVADHINAGRREPVEVEVFRGTIEELRAKNLADEAPMGVADDAEAAPDQPSGSEAVVTDRGSELSIELPPAGLNKGSKGLFAMAVFWNALVWLIAGGFGVAALNGNGLKGEELLILVGVLLLFGSIGVWILISSISMGKRYTIIDVVGDSLLISTTTPFRSRQHTFLAEHIDSIKAGPSGTEINDVPVLELQIRHYPVSPETGRSASRAKLGLLSSRPDDELNWLAGLLRQRLNVGASSQPIDRGPGVHIRFGGSD